MECATKIPTGTNLQPLGFRLFYCVSHCRIKLWPYYSLSSNSKSKWFSDFKEIVKMDFSLLTVMGVILSNWYDFKRQEEWTCSMSCDFLFVYFNLLNTCCQVQVRTRHLQRMILSPKKWLSSHTRKTRSTKNTRARRKRERRREKRRAAQNLVLSQMWSHLHLQNLFETHDQGQS